MTRPVDIPGSSSSTDNVDMSAASTAPAPALRQRGHTFAYPRAEANGNAHHLPPDAHMRHSSTSARSPSMPLANVGSASSTSSPSSSILSMLGFSPRSSTTWGQASTSSSFGAAYNADPATYSPSTTASSIADDPPEAVTPPSYAYPYSPSAEDEHHAYLNKKAQLHELDDVFDEMGALSGAPSGYAHHARSASASTARPAYFVNHGRRASMSIMPDAHDAFAADKERSNSTSSSSSPLGLFRRLSLSTSRKPVVPAPAAQDAIGDDPRMGRPLTKVKTAPARRLSPMGERIIRNHYDAF